MFNCTHSLGAVFSFVRYTTQYMLKQNKRKLLYVYCCGFLLSLCALLFFFLFIDPLGRSLVFIFIPVVLFWVLLFCGSQILIRYFVSGDKKAFNIMSLVGISTAVLLILLSGIGQLSGADVVITFCLCIVCSFYFYRSWE